MMSEEKKRSLTEQKEKLRKRYKGTAQDRLEVIPAQTQADFYDDIPRRVAVYVRVSTDDIRQTSSYELQKNYYEDMVKRHPGWELVDIYADEGISGTSLLHRDAFNRMITDCREGKLDLIVTKSVSRFSRNIVDCIGTVRELADLSPPVGVFFETENIYSLKDDTGMSLSFIATIAEEESHVKSNSMNASYEMRFANGIFLTPELLGYKHDQDGNLVINEEEAPTVRLIFFMYLYGYTCRQIAETLSALEKKTKKGNSVWSDGTILGILRNERHCGDVLAHKTFTPNYRNHLAKKNRGERPQYRERDHHEGIISRDDFIAVQRLLNNARYGNKGILPKLNVIREGILKGYVVINPRWAAFQADTYLQASESVVQGIQVMENTDFEFAGMAGEFDLREFEVTRTQFFDLSRSIFVSFGKGKIKFSTECVRKFEDRLYVELLIHPFQKKLVVRFTEKENRNAVLWAQWKNGKCYPRNISGAAFLGTLFTLCEWNSVYRYRVNGILYEREGSAVFLFDLTEPEIFVPCDEVGEEKSRLLTFSGNRVQLIPREWQQHFGQPYYLHKQPAADFSETDRWSVYEKGDPYIEEQLQVTDQEVIRTYIQEKLSLGLEEKKDE